MALVLKDRVKESSTTSGTGTITLGGAFVGFQTFNSAVASGSTVYYTIHNTTAGNDQEWEVGVGTFTAPNQLTRDTVFSSSTGGSKVSFSGSSVLEVFITQPAEQAVYINQATGKVEAFGNGTNVIAFTDINTTNLTANTVTLTAGTITTNAANSTDITNKQYVDGLFSTGISYHEPVLVESPTALNAVYVQPNGAGNGVGATLTNNGANVALVIDGVTLSNTARVLVYTQANAVQNGIYTVTNAGAPDSPGPGAAWVLTRATDADTYGLADPNALGAGDAVFVQSGNTGAGETYVCNTQGTITFGSTNITFAQISTAQIYAAGTGLNLSNLTFSIANTAVTAATYGNDGNVAQITVNAQGQLTNASNVAINASSITVGTLANARTTASDANGASTIVARDATGSFTANTITATDVNSTNVTATTGSFTNVSGNAATVTAINASNISSGTIANARTTGNTANSASTLVLRDADGSFGSNVITASLFSGDGSGINAINASNISSGTVANARTTAASANGASTIVLRDAGGNFSANTITANVAGDISGGTNINASNITSGTIANARTTASSSNGASTIVLRDAGGAFAAGVITGSFFIGDGSNVSAINASNISSGTIANARTSASSANGASTIVLRDANGDFAADAITANFFIGDGSNVSAINGSNVTTGTVANARTTAASANGANTIVSRDANGSFSANVVTATSGSFTDVSGNGSALSAINASNISTGTVATARLASGTANNSTYLRGDQTWAALSAPNNGTLTMNTSGTGLTGSATFTADQSGNTTFTVTSNANSANGASTIVARDAGGNFAAATITATTFSGAHSGDGSALSSMNASNLSSGTVNTARISGSYTGITGVGTIATGTWQGTSISTTYTDAKVTAVNAGTGISVNQTTGAVTVTNGGVTSITAGTGISVNASTGGVTITNTASGPSISNDSSTNATYYPVWSTTTSGSFSTAGISSTKLTYNPSTGTMSSTVFSATSDERLKDEITIITNALDKVGQLRGINYKWKDTGLAGTGLSAQDVQKVIPSAVVVDPKGNLSVAYGNMIGLLVEAIKELKAEVDALKGK